MFISCSNEEIFDLSSRYRISTSDYSIDFHYTEIGKKMKFDHDKMYYWSDRTKINKTEGAASKLLLDGDYIKYYPSGELMEKGRFDEGLKIGIWRTWEKNGDLASKEEFRRGLKWGSSVFYKQDTIVSIPYKSGEIHGVKEWIVDGTVTKSERYKRGERKKKKAQVNKGKKKEKENKSPKEKKSKKKERDSNEEKDATEVKR